VRVYAEDKNGKAQFIGEDMIGHIAAGSDISMKIGEAFDITVQPTLVRTTNVAYRVKDFEMKYELRNASKKPVKVNVYQHVYGRWADFTMLEENTDHQRKDDNTLVWTVDIPAEGEADLTFKIRQTSRW